MEWPACTFYYLASMPSRPHSHLHCLSPLWVCWSYPLVAVCKFILFPALQICCFLLFFPTLLLSEAIFQSLGLFFLETACSSVPLLLFCSKLLLSLSDFHIFPSAVTISSFLTSKRRITKHCVWYVNRKLEDKWCTTAIDWFRLCTQEQHFKSSWMEIGLRGAACNISRGGSNANRKSLRQTCEH